MDGLESAAAPERARRSPPDRSPEPQVIDSKTLAAAAARLADSKKAVNIRVLALPPHSALADYIVIATGLSRPQVKAVTEELHVRLKALGAHHGRIEGADMGWWVLVDYHDVIVHVMQPEAREYYDLDGLYSEAEELDWQAVPVPELGAARLAL